jgi:hypothetical protein
MFTALTFIVSTEGVIYVFFIITAPSAFGFSPSWGEASGCLGGGMAFIVLLLLS